MLYTRYKFFYLFNKKKKNLFLLIEILFYRYRIIYFIIIINIVIIVNIINIKKKFILNIIFRKNVKISTIKKIYYYYN